MNRYETDRTIRHLVHFASQMAVRRPLEEIEPLDDDPNPMDLSIDAAIEGVRQDMARRSEEKHGRPLGAAAVQFDLIELLRFEVEDRGALHRAMEVI